MKWLIPTLCLLASCTPVPQWYSIPPQRTVDAATEPSPLGAYVRFSERFADEYVISDILDGTPDQVWRWTAKRPTLRFVLPDTTNWDFHAVFALSKVTLAQTGPVTIRIFLNNQLLATTGPLSNGRHDLHWPVPPALLTAKAEFPLRFELDKAYIAPEDKAVLGIMLESAGFLKREK